MTFRWSGANNVPQAEVLQLVVYLLIPGSGTDGHAELDAT